MDNLATFLNPEKSVLHHVEPYPPVLQGNETLVAGVLSSASKDLASSEFQPLLWLLDFF